MPSEHAILREKEENLKKTTELMSRNLTQTTEKPQSPSTGRRFMITSIIGTNGSITNPTREKPERLSIISTRLPKEWSMISLLSKLTPSNTQLNSLIPSLIILNQDANAMPMSWLSAFKEKELNMVMP
jgi:hypothetical protein